MSKDWVNWLIGKEWPNGLGLGGWVKVGWIGQNRGMGQDRGWVRKGDGSGLS